MAESRELARYIQAGLVRGIGATSPRTAANRGVKHAPFVVLLGAAMPSVLAEVSFMSNPRGRSAVTDFRFPRADRRLAFRRVQFLPEEKPRSRAESQIAESQIEDEPYLLTSFKSGSRR